MMKIKLFFTAAFTLILMLLTLLPDPPRVKESCTIADAYRLMLEAVKVNPAYGRQPCPRLSGTPCPRPKPAPAQYCPIPLGGIIP